MANKQLSTESMEYVMDPMQLKKERGKRSTKKKKHQFALEETPEQAIQKAFDQQQQKELAVE